MIPDDLMKRIVRLRTVKKLGYREIGKRIGLSAGRVKQALIDEGRARAHDRLHSLETENVYWDFPGFEESETRDAPVARCPGCGYLVQAPCLVCWLAKRGPRPEARDVLEMADAGEFISHDLHGEDLERYLDLKHRHELGLYNCDCDPE